MGVLAADIGGTKTRMGVFDIEGSHCRLRQDKSFPSADYDGLSEIVSEFLGSGDNVCRAACFGIAGPVAGRRVQVTNLPWVVDADELEADTGIGKVVLLNDLEATGWGVAGLGDDQVAVLNPGKIGAIGNGAVIAAGTGLGEGGIYWDGQVGRPFASEGGHASFAPTDEVGGRLLSFLRRTLDHVSWERVLSGPGIVNIFRFVVEESGEALPTWFVETDRHGDPVPAISDRALDSTCDLCIRTLELFTRFYGEEAGNLVLKVMATGGLWIGGGIAPRILPLLEQGAFMEGFLAKGRMRPLLEGVPVKVILDDRTALLGAARCAASTV